MEKEQHNIDTHKDIIHRVLFLVILLKGVVISVPGRPSYICNWVACLDCVVKRATCIIYVTDVVCQTLQTDVKTLYTLTRGHLRWLLFPTGPPTDCHGRHCRPLSCWSQQGNCMVGMAHLSSTTESSPPPCHMPQKSFPNDMFGSYIDTFCARHQL